MLFESGVGDLWGTVREYKDAGISFGFKAFARIVFEQRVLDDQFARAVVADEEDGSAAFVGGVVVDVNAAEGKREGVAVVVDGSAATAARGAGFGGVGSVADGAVVREQAVDHRVRDADTAQSTAI